MEKKINVAELLKGCPKGMELDCPVWENLYFEEITNSGFPISCYFIQNGVKIPQYFTKYGHYHNNDNAKCVIFPKDKTSWEGFAPPCKFKDGDILSYQFDGFKNRTIYIYKQHSRMNTTYYVALSGDYDSEFMINDKEGHALNGYDNSVRLAAKEEKDKLFKAIKDNGYKWNAEKKCLEKLELQYPKTYKECCDILGLDTMVNDAQGYKWVLIIRLQELIICRDAYWKIAEEKMRLKNPWEPDYTIDEDGIGTLKFCIKNMGGKIKMVETVESNTILAFPSKEMRDAFFENFREDIEKINELL